MNNLLPTRSNSFNGYEIQREKLSSSIVECIIRKENVLLFAPSKYGKSTLIRQISKKLINEQLDIIECSAIQLKSAISSDQFFRSLLFKISNTFNYNVDLTPLQNFENCIQKLNTPCLLIIDEFHKLYQNNSVYFYQLIEAINCFINNKKILYLFSGITNIDELKTFELDICDFNSFSLLNGFDVEEMIPFINSFPCEKQIELRLYIEKVISYCNGNPFVTAFLINAYISNNFKEINFKEIIESQEFLDKYPMPIKENELGLILLNTLHKVQSVKIEFIEDDVRFLLINGIVYLENNRLSILSDFIKELFSQRKVDIYLLPFKQKYWQELKLFVSKGYKISRKEFPKFETWYNEYKEKYKDQMYSEIYDELYEASK